MSFGADLARGVAELRQHAESAMADTVLIERKSGTTLDPDTLEQVDEWAPVYEGRCKVRSSALQSRDADAGEVSYDVSSAYLDLPVSHPDSGGVRAGDRATIVTAALDSANTGRVFVVQRDMPRTYGIERRLFCQEVS